MMRRPTRLLARYVAPRNLDIERLFGHNQILRRVFTANPADVAIVCEHPHLSSAATNATTHTYGDLQRDVLIVANAMCDMRLKADGHDPAVRAGAAGVARFSSSLWQQPRRGPSSTSVFHQPPGSGLATAVANCASDHGGYNNVLLCKPGYEYVCGLLASWAMNLMAVPICHSHHFDTEMAHVFRDSKATTMCVDQQLFHEALPQGVFDKLVHNKVLYEENGVRIGQGADVVNVSDAPFNIRGVVEVTSLLRDMNERLLPGRMGSSVTVEYEDGMTILDQLRKKLETEKRRVVDERGNAMPGFDEAADAIDAEELAQKRKTRVDTELIDSESDVVELELNEFLKLRSDGLLDPPSVHDDALMIYTSGTTAKPKGVVHTHRSLDNQVQVLVDAWRWDSSDRILNVLPLHHIHGLVNILLCALAANATCVFSPFAGAPQLTSRLARGDLTLFMGVPAIYAKFAKHVGEQLSKVELQAFKRSMSNLRLLVSGSAALPTPLLASVEKLTNHTLLERYGMTEIGMALSQPYRPIAGRLPGTVGSPLPTVDALVVSEGTAQEPPKADGVAEHDRVGALMVRSPSLFDRYWGNPAATLKEQYLDPATNTVYFNTGDTVGVKSVTIEGAAGPIDGRQTIVAKSVASAATPVKFDSYAILGRSSIDIIKHNGYKLSALEIEASLLATGLISEAAVVGTPDDVAGELVVAVIVPAKKGIDEERLAAEMKAAAKSVLASYKCPARYVVLSDGLPRNAMGKVSKKELKKALNIA